MLRRYVAEFFGLFCIVFPVVTISASSHFPGGDGSLFMAACVPAMAVVALVYALGPISAAHFNPAVTIGFASAGRFPWRYVVPYCVAQCLGSITAAGLGAALYGGGHGLTVPAPGPIIRGVVMEAVLTFFLMFVIMAVATDKRVTGHLPVVGVGMVVFLGIMAGAPICGSSMNPARSLGPALFGGSGAMHVYWIYVVGPCIGAVAAARLYELIRGDERHARSAPNDLYEALQEIDEEAHISDEVAR